MKVSLAGTIVLTMLAWFVAEASAGGLTYVGKIEVIRHQGTRTLIQQENRPLENPCGEDDRYYILPTDSTVHDRIQSLMLTAVSLDVPMSITVSGCVSGRSLVVEANLDTRIFR